MTTGVLNYPRRPLTERERGIRETIDRIGDTHPPYIYVAPEDTGNLQGIVNSLTAAGGGDIWLGPGTYGGDLTIASDNMTLHGVGYNATTLTGSVTVATNGAVNVNDLTIRATGKSYGIKFYKSGQGVARCSMRNVYVGASASGAGDGPTDGIYLDGAILCTFDHVTSAFNTGNGLYIDTSNATYSSNVNTFRDCSFNGNGTGGGGGYGVKITKGSDGVAGIMLVKIEGGNIEDNVTGDVTADQSTFIILRGIDFETNQSHVGGSIVTYTGNQPCIIEDCNFVAGAAATITRFFIMTNCAMGVVQRCRVSGAGTWSAGAIGVFSEGCIQCTAVDNILNAAGPGRFISNRGQMRGLTA